jgi:lysophospholipase L1-like esterase
MMSENHELVLANELGTDDGHLSELGNRVIADSIIKKVDTMNINFIRPREKTLV